MGVRSWLVAGIVPGIERHPLKKLEVNEEALLRLLGRWRDEAGRDYNILTTFYNVFPSFSPLPLPFYSYF